MSLEIKNINPLEYQNWDDLAVSSETCSIFHSSAWARVLYDSYGYKPFYFTVINDNKLSVLVPVMEINSFIAGRRGVSLPFSDYCEPIISNSIKRQVATTKRSCRSGELTEKTCPKNKLLQCNSIKVEEVLDYIINFGKKAGWKYVEFRPAQTIFKHLQHSTYYYGHTLNLFENEDKIYSKFRNSTKRNIKKAIKAGVKVTICNSLDAIKEYYRLHGLTRKKHGIPPQPFYFFKNIFEHIIARNLGVVVMASYKGNYIAGNVYFHFNNKAYYKYGASDLRYRDLRASYLVMWEAIRWYAENDYKSLCFGRTDPDNKGLLQFKNGWGVDETVIKYFKYDLKKNRYVKDEFAKQASQNWFISHMPYPILKIIGNVLYKHIG